MLWGKLGNIGNSRNKGALLPIQGIKAYISPILNGLLVKKGTFCDFFKEQVENTCCSCRFLLLHLRLMFSHCSWYTYRQAESSVITV